MTSKINVDEISNYDQEKIEDSLRMPNSFTSSVFAVLSVLLWWAPFLGLVVALVSMWMNYKSKGWTKILSTIGLILAGLISVLCLIVMSLSAK